MTASRNDMKTASTAAGSAAQQIDHLAFNGLPALEFRQGPGHSAAQEVKLPKCPKSPHSAGKAMSHRGESLARAGWFSGMCVARNTE